MSKPEINIPAEFAVNGVKTPFSNAKIQNGFDRINPDVLTGDNLNKFIDDTYKGLNGVFDLYDIKLDHNQIGGSHILEAPNGVCEKDSNNNIVIKAGLKLLIADGLNTNGTYKNYIYTFEEDVTLNAGGRLDPDYSRPELVFSNGVGKIGEGDFMLSGAQSEFYHVAGDGCNSNDL